MVFQRQIMRKKMIDFKIWRIEIDNVWMMMYNSNSPDKKSMLLQLHSMMFQVKLDNVWAIFMTKIIITNGSSRLVGICYKFSLKMLSMELSRLPLLREQIMTMISWKNLGSKLHSKHASKMISMQDILWKMRTLFQVSALGDTPTILKLSRQKNGV